MRSQDLCWWLQGYFELRSEVVSLTQSQIEVIRRHLDLVKEVDRGHVSGFASWLDGLFSGLDAGLKVEGDSLTATIQKKLADEFEHVIDKQFEKDAETKVKLGAIHRPRPPNDDGRLVRC